MTQSIQLFTVGHSNRSLDDFINLLNSHNIRCIVDLRSNPSSRFEQFNQDMLDYALSKHGINYNYLGNLLGGKPHTKDNRWHQGRLNSAVIAELRTSERWGKGLSLLKKKVQTNAEEGILSCLLCSERRADQCHRNAVASDLSRILDIKVEHLDSKGAELAVQETML